MLFLGLGVEDLAGIGIRAEIEVRCIRRVEHCVYRVKSGVADSACGYALTNIGVVSVVNTLF